MDGPWRRFPRQAPTVTVQLESDLRKLHIYFMSRFEAILFFIHYLYAKFSACFLVPINWTMAKNCW